MLIMCLILSPYIYIYIYGISYNSYEFHILRNSSISSSKSYGILYFEKLCQLIKSKYVKFSFNLFSQKKKSSIFNFYRDSIRIIQGLTIIMVHIIIVVYGDIINRLSQITLHVYISENHRNFFIVFQINFGCERMGLRIYLSSYIF